jgi:ATP-dependent helicase/nuclease subunit A
MPPGSGEEWDEARNVFTNPSHAWLFAPGDNVVAGSEVPLLHRLEERSPETRVQGVIDRLLIGPDEIVIVDYKSNRITQDQLAETVEHYRSQMDAYRRALTAIYPERPIRTLLMFTHLQDENGPGVVVTSE